MASIPGRLAFAERIAAKFSPKIASLFGVSRFSTTGFSVGNLAVGHAADSTKGGGTVFDRDFILNSSKADFRGNIIHELTHVAGVGDGTSATRAENLADYARYSLNPHEAAGWTPNAAVQKIAENRGTVAGNSNNTGTGGGTNHNTTTQNNSRTPSGQTGGVPSPADPSSYGAYAATVAGAQMQLAAAAALRKSQIGVARGQYGLDMNAATNLRPTETVQAEAAALANGGIGSSVDLQNRATAVTDSATAQEQALAARNASISGSRVGYMGALGEYSTTTASAAAQLANAQAMANAERFKQDQFDTVLQKLSDLRKRLNRNRTRDLGSPYGANPGPPNPSTYGGPLAGVTGGITRGVGGL